MRAADHACRQLTRAGVTDSPPHACAACTFANLGGGEPAAVLTSRPDATASFSNCTFHDNRFDDGSAGSAAGGGPVHTAALRSSTTASLRLERCTFRNNTAPGAGTAGDAATAGAGTRRADVAAPRGARVFADDATRSGAPGGMALRVGVVAVEPLAASAAVEFLSSGDEWLRARQQVRSPARLPCCGSAPVPSSRIAAVPCASPVARCFRAAACRASRHSSFVQAVATCNAPAIESPGSHQGV